jgi:hypothetical protein
VDEMTLPEVEELAGYWTECPPLHLLVRAFVGYQPSSSTTAKRPETESDLAELMSLVNGG